MTAAEITSVTFDTHALARLAGQYRTNLDHFNASVLDRRDLVLVDHFVGTDQDFVRERIPNFVKGHTPEYAVAKTFDDLAAFDQRGHLDSIKCAAIFFGNY